MSSTFRNQKHFLNNFCANINRLDNSSYSDIKKKCVKTELKKVLVNVHNNLFEFTEQFCYGVFEGIDIKGEYDE